MKFLSASSRVFKNFSKAYAINALCKYRYIKPFKNILIGIISKQNLLQWTLLHGAEWAIFTWQNNQKYLIDSKQTFLFLAKYVSEMLTFNLIGTIFYGKFKIKKNKVFIYATVSAAIIDSIWMFFIPKILQSKNKDLIHFLQKKIDLQDKEIDLKNKEIDLKNQEIECVRLQLSLSRHNEVTSQHRITSLENEIVFLNRKQEMLKENIKTLQASLRIFPVIG